MKNKTILMLLIAIMLMIAPSVVAEAAPTLDEITDYRIQVDVNEDATLTITYHIDWLVLDDEYDGPLTWVRVGTPNSKYVSFRPLSDNIDTMDISTSGNIEAEIYFDRAYYAGETVSFDFEVVQDYMYDVNKLEEGYTVYGFTPGWFDDSVTDHLEIRWNAEKADSWSPSCEMEDGYLCFETSLSKGEKFHVDVTYPNDAYAFDLSKSQEEEEDEGPLFYIFAIVFVFAIFGIPIALVVVIIYAISKAIYRASKGLGYDDVKKITRTKITYSPTCPGCGAARQDGQSECPYCGRSFILSEEVIDEKDVSEENKEAMKLKKDGEYHYSSNPNVFVRVHVAYVPNPRPRSSGGRGHGGCAHSHCACACACACAGGGRAGCTNKDFYKTGLKLRGIKRSI